MEEMKRMRGAEEEEEEEPPPKTSTFSTLEHPTAKTRTRSLFPLPSFPSFATML